MENIRRKNKMIETYSILLADIISIILSFVLSVYIRFNIINYEVSPPIEFHIIAGSYLLIICLLYTLLFDANRNFFSRGWLMELYYIIRYTAILLVGFAIVLFLTQQAYDFSRWIYILFAIFNVTITYFSHMALKKFMWNYYRKSTASTKMMVVALDVMAKDVVGNLVREKEWFYDVTAVAVYDRDRIGQRVQDVPVVASKENLYDVLVQMMVDEVFICLPGVPVLEIRQMVESIEEMGLVCHYNVDLFSRANPNTYAQKFAGYSVISFTLKEMDSRRMLIKRLMDIVGALVGLAITAVLTPFVALAIKLDSPGPVFFSQVRIGKNGRHFRIWKFRSMYMDAEERKKELESQNEIKGLMFKMKDDPRITKVGKFIRKTSIDETPQFLNILMGEMSLVGTRPPTVDEFEQYTGYYRRRMSITPGLTGMWQVSGRSDLQDFDEIVKLDLEYIDNWSLMLDIKILLMTIYIVFFGKGAK